MQNSPNSIIKQPYSTEWNLSYLLSGDEDPTIKEKNAVVKEQNDIFIAKWLERNDYLQDPIVLKAALDEYEKLQAIYDASGDVGYYFYLRSNQEQNNPKVKAKLNKMRDFTTDINNSIEFFTHRLATVPQEIQEKFLQDESLKDYRHFLECLFAESKYLLSEDEEKILNLKAGTSYSNWVKMTADFISREEREVLDEKQKTKVVGFTEITKLMNSKNKQVRDISAKAFNEIMEKYVDVAEAEINSILQDKKVNDDLRKIERPDLTRHISDDIDTEVVDALIASVTKRYDISQKFYELKAKLLGQEKLAYHERNIEYGEIEKEYSYEESVEIIAEVFKKLDPQFFDILKDFVENGKIDVFPRKGKYNGAFSICGLKVQPGYVLLNHTDKLNDVTTFAHEMGHAINNELIRPNQNALNFSTPLSTAEVASTFMEDFVLDELEKDADDQTKLSIMMMRLNDAVSTIQRQVACYSFEKDLHEEFRKAGYLSHKEIGELFQKHMKAYMGDAVLQSEGSQNWWVYWSHIRVFFYVYSYASGLLISKALQNSVKKDPEFIQKVKIFLSAGTSDSPKNIFKELGIDITDNAFWDSGLKEIETLLNDTIVLATKLGKLN